MNRVDRLLGYLIIFQGKELVRAQDLAERFEVSERTVYRDVDALCELGVPLYGVAGEGYRLMEGYYLPPIMFNEDEARALFLAVSLLTSFTSDGPTRTAAQSAIEKIRSVLPDATLAQVEALQTVLGFYAFGRPPLNLDDPKFVQLSEAIQNCLIIKLRYHAMHSNSVSERTVEPLHLAYLQNVWVMTGYCHLRQDVRNFRLERIDALTVTTQTFEPRIKDIGPDTDRYQQDVMVRFDPAIVRWVKESQHFTFVREEPAVGVDSALGTTVNHDEGKVMVYRVRSSEQIVPWLMGWGSTFEVLDPPEIRQELERIAKQIVERHSS